MKRIHDSRLSLAILLLFLFSQGLRAHSSSPTSGQQPAPAPAQSQPPSSSPAAPKKKPKKVWTNDVGAISGGVSVVGDSSGAAARKPEDKRTDARGPSGLSAVASFRKELQSLRGQLEQTEKQISDLRNFKADSTSPSGGIKMTGRYTMVPLEEQIRQLEARRKQIQARIDDVEDQARKLGIPPGDLR